MLFKTWIEMKSCMVSAHASAWTFSRKNTRTHAYHIINTFVRCTMRRADFLYFIVFERFNILNVVKSIDPRRFKRYILYNWIWIFKTRLYIYVYIYIFFVSTFCQRAEKFCSPWNIRQPTYLRTSIHKSPSTYLNINPGFLICKAEQTNVDCVRRWRSCCRGQTLLFLTQS
jgi:hypothetical protein